MTDIDELHLSARAANCLRAEDITTIEHLRSQSAARLLEIPNLGIVSLREIAVAMHERGCPLTGVDVNPIHQPETLNPSALKSIRKRALVEITYWTCVINEHRHQTENAANVCIQLFIRKTKKKSTVDRNVTIVNQVLAGVTYANAALEFQLSNDRIRQIVFQQCRSANSSAFRRLAGSQYGVPSIKVLRANKHEFLR